METIWNLVSNVLSLRKINNDSIGLVNLSRKEKVAVQTSWALARQDYEAAGLGFFRV